MGLFSKKRAKTVLYDHPSEHRLIPVVSIYIQHDLRSSMKIPFADCLVVFMSSTFHYCLTTSPYTSINISSHGISRAPVNVFLRPMFLRSAEIMLRAAYVRQSNQCG